MNRGRNYKTFSISARANKVHNWAPSFYWLNNFHQKWNSRVIVGTDFFLFYPWEPIQKIKFRILDTTFLKQIKQLALRSVAVERWLSPNLKLPSHWNVFFFFFLPWSCVTPSDSIQDLVYNLIQGKTKLTTTLF